MATSVSQFARKGSVTLVEGDKALDLSDLHFTFSTVQDDNESPSNCTIRLYNLSPSTISRIRGEFSRVILNAGYEGQVGVIFDGTIRQFRIGRENSTDTYLDILSADGDLAYNYAIVNKTLAAGSKPDDRIQAALQATGPKGVTGGYLMPFTGGVLPRGKVLFGMARAVIRQEAASQGATWTINDGKVNIVPLDSYLPGEALVLNAQTGMIGMPEQTNDGIRIKCLLNPKLVTGGLIKIDNRSINQTLQKDPAAPRLAFNQYAGVQNLASVTDDGLYRCYVIEHNGDSRGNAWYTDITALAVNPDSLKVKAAE